ncbi:unnamed protein product, partial [Scytosiphon promiscuus]
MAMEEEMIRVKEALAMCSSEAKRLLNDDVLAVPAIQHMLSTFLADKSRSFEDWIMEPRCRHSLSKLSSRIDSADAPAVTANYEEQVASASYERRRTSTVVGGWGGQGVCGGTGGGGRAAASGGWGGDSGGTIDTAAAALASIWDSTGGISCGGGHQHARKWDTDTAVADGLQNGGTGSGLAVEGVQVDRRGDATHVARG